MKNQNLQKELKNLSKDEQCNLLKAMKENNKKKGNEENDRK